MATAKKTSKVTATVKSATAKKPASNAEVALKPLKTAFNKTSLVAHLAAQAGVEPRAAKAVLAALEGAVLASVHKKGVGEFTLPGLMKISALSVPAKKKRFGKDPFTGEERWFAPKPASVKIKVRALKKLKDAAL
jgi:nucleoid DNA-binding protein